jgi:hypothetical protein
MRHEAGNFDPCALRCGGDRRCPFVGSTHVAAFSARISCGIASRKHITGPDPNEVTRSLPCLFNYVYWESVHYLRTNKDRSLARLIEWSNQCSQPISDTHDVH